MVFPASGRIIVEARSDGTITASSRDAYFGMCSSDGTISGDNADDTASDYMANWNWSVKWTCPGTGPQSVGEISIYAKANVGTPVVKLGIYNSAGTTLLAHGTATLNISGASYSWQGHLSPGEITWDSGSTLTGGTDYVFCFAYDGAGTIGFRAISGASGVGQYDIAAGYTTTMPPDLTAITPTNNTFYPAIRVKVTGAA